MGAESACLLRRSICSHLTWTRDRLARRPLSGPRRKRPDRTRTPAVQLTRIPAASRMPPKRGGALILDPFPEAPPGRSRLAESVCLQQARQAGIPIIMGILPLRTPRHAEFLHQRVAGIAVPRAVRERMERASDPVAEGVANAREMLLVAREGFRGACLMPPFGHYEVVVGVVNS